MAITNWISGRVFKFVHGNNLVYNTCWEDPRLDRKALQLTKDDRVLVITSAGCNALDYSLCNPAHVYAVDMNPRQNALLELKMAAIRKFEYEDFYALFGEGHHTRAKELYASTLRSELGPFAQDYWDKWIKFFHSSKRLFLLAIIDWTEPVSFANDVLLSIILISGIRETRPHHDR